jgi:hypothetical protein
MPGRVAGGLAALVVIGSLVAGCGQPAPSGGRQRITAAQQCVQAVFDVLGNMVSRPFDDRPFQDFITRYGTGSVAYTTYRDLFTSFHSLSGSLGVRGAEDRLRPAATRDCAGGQ